MIILLQEITSTQVRKILKSKIKKKKEEKAHFQL